jgi:hypothetical protein
MVKTIGKLTLAGILAAVILGVPVRMSAQDQPKPPVPPAATAPQPKAKSPPFKGKLGAVDKTAKTITLDDKLKRTFQITSETKLMKNGKPATLDDGVVGDPVTGTYQKGDDGKLVAKTVYFGGKKTETSTK